MNVKIFIFFFVTFLLSTAFSKERCRLLGIVTHAETGDSLQDVNVSIAETTFGASSNAKGAYLIDNVPAGIYSVIFASVGFQADTLHDIILTPGQTKRVDARLQPTALRMHAVEIEGNRLLKLEPDISRAGAPAIHPQAVESIAGTFNDVNRTVRLLSGVVSSGDYTGAYALRGGSLDQNAVFLDGICIPNPYRMRLLLGGGFGLFNTSTISQAQFYTGHFPGQYGDFLSSVLNIESRNGRRDRFGVGGSIDLLQSHFALEGPLPGKKGTWLVSARRSYLDLIAKPYANKQSALPYMFDLDGKLVYDLSENTQLTYKLLHADEGTKMIAEAEQDIEIEQDARLNLQVLGLESRLSNNTRAIFRTALFKENFYYKLFADKSDPAAASGNYMSKISSLTVHQAFTIALNKQHQFSPGLYASSETSRLDLETNVVGVDFTRRDVPPDIRFDQNSGHIGAYIDYTVKIVQPLETTLGIRYDYDELIKKDDVSGKVSAAYNISPQMKIDAFWGNVLQYPNAMTIFTRDVPLNFADHPERLSAECATHYVLGVDRQWGYDISTRFELYYKDFTRLLLPQDRVDYLAHNSGHGYAKGFDLVLEKAKGPRGRLSGLLSYSFAKSEYRDNYNKIWIPFNYDRRHGVSAMLDVAILSHWGINTVWRYDSGLPYNEISGYTWHLFDRSRYVKSTWNERRYPDYSRVDVRLSYRSRWKSSRVMVYLDFINLFNQQNIYERMYYTLDTENNDGSVTKSFHNATIYTMPFIPSLGLSIWY